MESARIEGDQDAYTDTFYACLDAQIPARLQTLEGLAQLADRAVDKCSDTANVIAALAGEKTALGDDVSNAKAMNSTFQHSAQARATAYKEILSQGKSYFLKRCETKRTP